MRGLFNNRGLATATIVLIIVAIVVVAGGTMGGVYAYNAYQEKKQEEAAIALQKSIDDARNNVVNTYNDRINQIVASLNVEKDGVASIDNNEDVDAMNNAVNELNTITNEINNDSVLTQEQKDVLNASVETNKNNINSRINVINESRKVIKANQETTLGLYCSPSYLKGKYSGVEEIPASASELHYMVKPYNIEVIYDTRYLKGGDDHLVRPKRLEGKLKNFVENLNGDMPYQEFIDKLESVGNNEKTTEFRKGNPSSPYAFPEDGVSVDFCGKSYVVYDDVLKEEFGHGWNGRLTIAVDANGKVGPESTTWFLMTSSTFD